MAVPALDLNEIELEDQPDIPYDPETDVWYKHDQYDATYQNWREWYGQEWADRLNYSIGFENDTEKSWRGIRPLGKGGFGWAALFARHRDGKVIDQIVIKDTKDDEYQGYLGILANRDTPVPVEAMIMQQLNHWNNPNIVKLRAFKRYIVPDRRTQRHRFYLEYCPHGDLSTLKLRYRQFSRFFPESFMWHTFHSLANALVDLKNRPYIYEGTTEADPDAEVVHFDIKGANIFLGDPPPLEGGQWRDAEHAFPTIKLGDYGISEITDIGDAQNPTQLLGGSRDIQPPEQDALQPSSEDAIVLRDWFPEWQNRPWRGFGTFDEKHNVYGIAQVMWALVTTKSFKTRAAYRLARHQEKDGHFMDRIDTMRGSIEKPGKKLGPRMNAEEPGEYSDELRKLIRDCLHPDPRRRPTAQQVFDVTRDGLDDTLEVEGDNFRTYRPGAKRAGQRYARSKNPHKLYFHGNEMTEMAPGQLSYYPWPTDASIGAPPLTYCDSGWVSGAHYILRGQAGYELQRERGLPNAPIIFPKLRWFPPPHAEDCSLGHEFYLMRKRRQDLGRTRWDSTIRPPGLSNVYENATDERGDHVVLKVDYEVEMPARREKDVWVAPGTEFGPWHLERYQTRFALAIATWDPPVTCTKCLSARHRDHECLFDRDEANLVRILRVDRFDQNRVDTTDEDMINAIVTTARRPPAHAQRRAIDVARAAAMAGGHSTGQGVGDRECGIM